MTLWRGMAKCDELSRLAGEAPGTVWAWRLNFSTPRKLVSSLQANSTMTLLYRTVLYSQTIHQPNTSSLRRIPGIPNRSHRCAPPGPPATWSSAHQMIPKRPLRRRRGVALRACATTQTGPEASDRTLAFLPNRV